MGFKTRAKDYIQEVKQIKKLLPYTVTPIGGKEELKAWKADQARKQDEWDAGKQARYEAKKVNAVAIVSGEKQAGPDKDKELMDKYRREQAEMARKAKEKYAPSMAEMRVKKDKEYEAGESLLNKALDFFTNIKFEP